MSAGVSLQGLTRRFGAVTAVEELTFEVGAGELFGIVGPDGAGKTTTLRMLAGVLPPSAGDALVGGVSVARAPEAVKPRIAYMAQRFGLYEDLTVRENLAFYADLFRVPRAERPARLERLYAFSALDPFKDRLAGALSGGMKQKLALMCSLIHQPDVLLLDEPTFGVDPISRRDLWLILHEMVAAGVTIVVSTAYLDEAERCDRVALLHEGRVRALDTPAALQASLPGELLLVHTDRPRAARDALRALPRVRRAALFGEVVHTFMAAPGGGGAPGGGAREASSGGEAAVRAALAAAGVAVREVRRGEPSLEDVFIELTAPEPAEAT
ncbi:MAG TPA: ABC transporter ATP-binding protein [Longimicrobiales bacterium]|nr:ABC transporter ATP-binding protein [Longimicrobiales bacterium]